MGLGSSRVVLVEEGDNSWEYKNVLVETNRKTPLAIINKRVRVLLIEKLLFVMPELFAKEDVMRVRGRHKYANHFLALVVFLYGGSIFVGRRVILKFGRAPFPLMGFIYLTPMCICLPLAYYGIYISRMKEVIKVADKYKDTLDNEKLFASILPTYAYRFDKNL
eukprot:TRINITY_DN5463_c0_g3_i4.p1 TRINITY_DN5463_c0_g3~~TRINITY_DN5463_c0_g3_i4.p1  ORF type:complete len:164 (-),score=32.12 TRINITY_DN5463_c0_g3_i4:87-578(-)